MSGVAIVTCGRVSGAVIDQAIAAIDTVLGMTAKPVVQSIDPDFALDPKRRQYNSSLLLQRVRQSRPRDADLVLGITEIDIFILMLSFVFGQAQLGGPAAIVSTARLRQEFYRLPPDEELMAGRLQKEVLHELGHTLSLIHCPDPACVMSLATGVGHVDMKSIAYCETCRSLIGAAQMESSK